VAKTLAKLNPTMTFIYVSGAGTDSTERGRSMWARVNRTENALLQMPFARRKRLVAWWGISRFYQTLCRHETINRWLALAAQ
jgi:hypothetical protein